jgi:hypothetical protein
MAEDDEKIEQVEDKKDVKIEENSSEATKLLSLKKEVADLYIQKAKETWSNWSFLIWKWKSIKKYLVSESFRSKLKWQLVWSALSSFDPELVNYFKNAKETLDSASTEQQLQTLKTELSWTMAQEQNKPDAKTDNTQQTQTEVENTTINNWTFDKLLIGTVWTIAISQIDIDYVNNEWWKIEKNLDIKWDFVDIKKIEDSDWKVVLECSGWYGYIHKDAIKDLIWFSLFFYKKSLNPLTLISSYRTIEQQRKLKIEKPTLAAEPGKSWHNLWLSIDITEDDRYSRKIWWIQGIKAMAAKFNFNPISWEDWHFDHGTLPPENNRLNLAQNLDHEFSDLKLAA